VNRDSSNHEHLSKSPYDPRTALAVGGVDEAPAELRPVSCSLGHVGSPLE
jgi:hypothetical protein